MTAIADRAQRINRWLIRICGALLQALTGSGQDQLVAVVSTLGIAVLFVPLRTRMQSLIDRRSYRRSRSEPA